MVIEWENGSAINLSVFPLQMWHSRQGTTRGNSREDETTEGDRIYNIEMASGSSDVDL